MSVSPYWGVTKGLVLTQIHQEIEQGRQASTAMRHVGSDHNCAWLLPFTNSRLTSGCGGSATSSLCATQHWAQPESAPHQRTAQHWVIDTGRVRGPLAVAGVPAGQEPYPEADMGAPAPPLHDKSSAKEAHGQAGFPAVGGGGAHDPDACGTCAVVVAAGSTEET